MKNYKRYLLYNIVFLLSEIKFMIFHLRTLDLNNEYRDKLNKIENDVNDLMLNLNQKLEFSQFDQVFQGDDEK